MSRQESKTFSIFPLLFSVLYMCICDSIVYSSHPQQQPSLIIKRHIARALYGLTRNTRLHTEQ